MLILNNPNRPSNAELRPVNREEFNAVFAAVQELTARVQALEASLEHMQEKVSLLSSPSRPSSSRGRAPLPARGVVAAAGA